MSLLGISSEAWIGFAGAITGGVFTLAGQVASDGFQRRSKRKDEEHQVQAAALLIQDDFLHYQVTLARSLDRCQWWESQELLEAQASVQDRKAVWAAMGKKHAAKAVDGEAAKVVASAQGWMDYLIGCRKRLPEPPPPLCERDAETMVDTFKYLKDAREALSDLAGKPDSLNDSPVMKQLVHCKTEDELLERRCPDQPVTAAVGGPAKPLPSPR